jgi:hypothetical protein
MSTADLFVTSTVPWFRDDPDHIHTTINKALSENSNYLAQDVTWRPPNLTDFRGHNVPAAVERVVRWDTRVPDEVFKHGLRPRYQPQEGEDLAHANVDLGSYLDSHPHSIFVGTVRFHSVNGRNVRWKPHDIKNHFEYEIFAYGGIDVSSTLGDDHQHGHRKEIVFPGGIRSEFIRTAREYDENGQAIRIYANAGYNPSANGDHLRVNTTTLPEPVSLAALEGPLEIVMWTGPGESTSIPNPSTHYDPIRAEGDHAVDNLTGTGTSLPSRACFLRPGGLEAYFFLDTQYARVSVDPGTADSCIVFGPTNIIHEWPSLKKARFCWVDTAFPSSKDSTEVFFFCRDRYVLVNVIPESSDDSIISGPKSMIEWPSFQKVGFTYLDAALPSPKGNGETYFFSGTQCALIKVTPGTTDDHVIDGPKDIATAWPSLRTAGFSTIDAVLPNPKDPTEAYFFSGPQYALIKVIPGTNSDHIIDGPKPVAENWPSLRQVHFY